MAHQLSERGTRAAEVVGLLTKARQFLATRDNWVQGKYIRSKWGGGHVACAIGAVGLANNNLRIADLPSNCGPIHRTQTAALRALAEAITGSVQDYRKDDNLELWARDIYEFNDGNRTDHKDVVAAFDLAIEQQCKIVREDAVQASFFPEDPEAGAVDSSTWTG